MARSVLFCSHHVLTSSVRYQSTDARQNGIYLLNSNCIMDEELIRLLRPYNKQTSINVIKNRNCGAPLLGLAKYIYYCL